MKVTKNKLIMMIVSLPLLIILDQWTKYVAVMKLRSQPPFSIIRKVLELVYVENTGSAFGMMAGRRILLMIVSILMIFAILWYYYQIPDAKRYHMARILVLFLTAGAIGNLIDRVRLGYVIDFIYVRIIDFPVFNIADCYVVVSIILLLLIYWKEITKWMKNG